MKHNAKSFSNLLGEILVREDVTLLEEELKLLGESVFTQGVEAKIRERIAAAIKADLKGFEGEAKIYYQEALELVRNLPEIELTIAFEPTPEAVRRMVTKVRQLVQKEVVLSLVINPAIVGGALIATRGEFRDYSISAKLLSLLNESVGVG
jgi:hypothetical protein